MKTIKLECVNVAHGWDDPYVYFRSYFTININPHHIESVEKNAWGLCTTVKSVKEVKGFFGKVNLVDTSTTVNYNKEKQLWFIRTTSGEVYRTYDDSVLVEAGLIEKGGKNENK